MLSMQELLGKYKLEDQSQEIQDNLSDLLIRINKVRTLWGKSMIVTSGLRSEADQVRINPSAPQSLHKLGLAVDISDPSGDLRQWVLENLNSIREIGLWMEDFRYTKGWVHFGARPPKSGKRIFIPIAGPIPHSDLWDGNYQAEQD